jgi:hypothetical protein
MISNKVVLCFDEPLDEVDTSDINLRIKLADSNKTTVKFWLENSEAYKCAYQQESTIIKHTNFTTVKKLVLNTVSDDVKCELKRRTAQRLDIGLKKSIRKMPARQVG